MSFQFKFPSELDLEKFISKQDETNAKKVSRSLAYRVFESFENIAARE